MKAPKKIYLQKNTTTDLYGEIWPEWFESRTRDADIEYTRTDVFIKKACEWLEEHLADFFGDCIYEEPDTLDRCLKSMKKAMEE